MGQPRTPTGLNHSLAALMRIHVCSSAMASDPQKPGRQRATWTLSAHTLSNTRLALVACTLLATVAVLLVVTLEARSAQDALEEAASYTLRDYSGYAGRMLGADVLRRFSEQRAAILAPVTGTSGRNASPPALSEITALGEQSFAELGVINDSSLGYFRLSAASGTMEGARGITGNFATRVTDTVRALTRTLTASSPPGIIALEWSGDAYSISYAPHFDVSGHLTDIYGFAYTRNRVVSVMAARVFREVPLLPVSFAGVRWNYDTTRVQVGEVTNDSLLAMRITDRRGRELWKTRDADTVLASSLYRGRSVISTNAGGIVVEAAMRPAAEPSLIPSIVRRAQRWTLRGLIALALLLVMVSLLALRGERLGAHARRAEAMEQLALGIRHEINNALASVLLNAELLHEENTMTEEQRERLEAIVEQAERMRKVVQRLENSEKLNVLVPYLNEGLMVDLSTTRERDPVQEFGGTRRAPPG